MPDISNQDNPAPAIPALTSAGPDAVIPSTSGNDLAPLVWRGLVLTVVSLGFYRFWYRTDLRRWYWRNTVIDGHGLEYRGTARELFIGFLIALAVVLPLYFSGSLIALFAGETLGNAVAALSGLIFALLVQYGAFRSRRYRLTRTFWRGVRFDQKGSGWRYAILSLLWLLATIVSAGLMLPFLRRALERYRIENTWFGNVRGQFGVAMRPLMMRWLVIWLISVAGLAAGMFLGLAIEGLATNVEGLEESMFLPLAGVIVIPLVLLMPFLLWPFYRAAEFRAFTNATALGEVRFMSRFSTRSYYGVFLRFVLIFLLLFVLWCIVLAVLGFILHSIGLMTFSISSMPIALLGLLTLGYLGTFLLFGGIKETVLNQRFWRLAMQTLTIINLAAVEGILVQPVADEMATGEGLADAFDFGGV